MSVESDWLKSKEQYIHLACSRNAMRKSNGLPPLDLREEMERLALSDYRQFYRKICEKYAHVRDRIQADVLLELKKERADLGYGNRNSAKLYLSMKTLRLYRDYLSKKGYPPPQLETFSRLFDRQKGSSVSDHQAQTEIRLIVDNVDGSVTRSETTHYDQ